MTRPFKQIAKFRAVFTALMAATAVAYYWAVVTWITLLRDQWESARGGAADLAQEGVSVRPPAIFAVGGLYFVWLPIVVLLLLGFIVCYTGVLAFPSQRWTVAALMHSILIIVAGALLTYFLTF